MTKVHFSLNKHGKKALAQVKSILLGCIFLLFTYIMAKFVI
ncbi:hypothetical protein PCIT_b0356 [Pseudoalteromonas citrea]|uniref:Uncharacterized protein n=1 Tax=Pseudoalteromonas citrea TaxID=43655 RepID=A0AAD4FPV1_9GAMM|nr:hypothetical protein PCIT_b0356 [Pseudoalteromonas citrea]